MKKYRTYTAKKFRMPRRIIFFCVVALIIIVLTVILGNVLKNKLENTPRDTSDILTTTDSADKENSDKEPEKEPVIHDEAFGGIVAGCLDLSAAEGPQEANNAVEALKAAGYNAVSFNVTDGNGMITYASPALEEYSRLTASDDLVTFDELKEAAKAAKSLGLRLCAVMTATEGICDELVAEELSAIGFDELCVRGFEEYTQFDNELVSRVNGYIDMLRGVSGEMVFSLCFDGEFYKAPSNAPYIEKVYANTEFLAIDMTECSTQDALALAEDIVGSFNAYLLRPILSGSDSERAAEISEVLTGSSITARQYVSAPVIADDNGGED
ncbi:MAG: hypothetical protein E7647_02025 [Ruminococcaceae bacterium]|nr:hypothetical protein [Oscillospiraceae bacterium]